jgi:NTP pyrophosphatase (non-canonical NTP hydrolase)
MIASATTNALWARITAADDRYGNFASTHEALGVAYEEWTEFRDAIHANDRKSIGEEALDLAAALIRLHDQLVRGGPILARSGIA